MDLRLSRERQAPRFSRGSKVYIRADNAFFEAGI